MQLRVNQRLLAVIVLPAIACLALAAWPGHAAASASTVSWSTCYVHSGPFECATVRVPLDYDSPRGERIAIALTRLPATDPDRRIGSLFLNPGGPGGSGVDFVVGLGQALYTPEVRARFDLVGFDPRGVMRSSGLRCFGTPKQWGPAGTPAFPTTPAEEALKADADRYLNDACEQRGTRPKDHMSTANVARDMDVLRRAVGDDKLSYAGYSYGSYLGVTYANMFPDRVRAVIVDGVVDPIAWSTGRGNEALTVPFSTRVGSQTGAQETLDEFFRLCDEAGDACAFSGGAAARFDALAERARQGRLKFVFPDGFTIEGGYSDLIGLTFGALYSSTIWREFAQLLADIEESSSPAVAGARVSAFVAKYGASMYPNFVEGNPAVACADSDSPDDYAAWSAAGAQADEHSLFGRLWTWGWSTCAQWSAFDSDRYMGPFTASTANPVLVVGPRFDAATRYEGAVTVHDLMPNSALLTVNGWGHTSLFMSQCADTAVERYLVDGATPAPGTTCDQDVGPFEAVPAAAKSDARNRMQALSHVSGHSTRSRHAARSAGAFGRHTRTHAGNASWSDLSGSTIDALGAQVARDGKGNAVYAWSSSDAATGVDEVRARTRSAKGKLGPIVSLSDPAAPAFDVRVAVNERGTAAFSWLQFDADDRVLVVKTRTRSANGALGPIADVSEAGTDTGEHKLAVSDAGTAVITWTSLDLASGQVHAMARARAAAGALGPVVSLADPALDSFSSQVAIDARGVATFAWALGNPATHEARVQTRTRSAAGALGAVTDLSGAAQRAGEPKVAVDDDGDAVFDWLEFDESLTRAVVHARSLSRRGALGPVVELSDPADDAWDAVVAVDDKGNAVFTWWVVGRTGARVEARTRSIRGAVGPRVTLSDARDDGFEPQVDVDEDGDAVVTWLAFNRDGVRVQARARSRHGALGPVADLSRPAHDAFSTQVAIDDAGNAAFGWSALDSESYQVLGRSFTPKRGLGPLEIISRSDRVAFDAQVNSTSERLEAHRRGTR